MTVSGSNAPAPDPRPWRAVVSGFIAFGGVGLIFLFGARLIGVDSAEAAQRWLSYAAASPWALPATVALFAALAFVGVPQVALIAAAVLALGPWRGMADSWIGTMVSALIGFWLGRRFGGPLLRDWAGPRAQRIVAGVSRNGFWASLLVRLAPTAPFVFVNMAAGVAQVGLADFAAGTAIGIAPKIALTALAGGSLAGLASGAAGAHGWLIGAAAAGWIVMTLAGYAWLRRRGAEGG